MSTDTSPRKVFRIGHRFFWACNGQEIRDAWCVEWREEEMFLLRHERPRVPITMVPPPTGRCRHCGEKL